MQQVIINGTLYGAEQRPTTQEDNAAGIVDRWDLSLQGANVGRMVQWDCGSYRVSLQDQIVTPEVVDWTPYAVRFRAWSNNWSEWLPDEYIWDLDEAKAQANEAYTMTVDYIGENFYANNGLQVFVVDANGEVIYEPIATTSQEL